MAQKRLKEDPPPAPASSVEEEESENDDASEEEEEEKEKSENEEEEVEGDDDDDDDEEEEEEEEKKEEKKEEESESDSELESEPKSPLSPSVSGFTIKPIVSKPMEHGTPKPKKLNNNVSTPISVSASSKRAAESDPSNTKDLKKRKVLLTSTANGEDEDQKKGSGTGPVQRLWGEEDELAVLKGMIEYGSKRGSDPYADMGAFHEFVKKSLRVEVSKAQLMDKIRRMKKKYLTNFDKGGNDMVFSKPHEHKAFELSKKIWGAQTSKKPKTKDNSVTVALPKEEMVENGGVEGFLGGYPCLEPIMETMAEAGVFGFSGSGTTLVNELMARIGSKKLREMEDKCRAGKVAQLEVYVRRMELVHELGQAALDAMKRGD